MKNNDNNKHNNNNNDNEKEINVNLIYGRNPVIEALKGGRTIDKILISGKEGSIKVIVGLAHERGVIVQSVPREQLNSICQGGNHQGVAAFAAAHDYCTVEDILRSAEEKGHKPFIILLDEIKDPHNLGSIIRTANAAGVDGIIIPARRSCGLSDVVAKTSAGALEYTKVAKVTNLTAAIEDLKKRGLWFFCASGNGKQLYTQADYKGAIGLVIGSEGEGVSPLIERHCDFTVRIPMMGEITSLNAAVSAGILMYEIIKHRS